MTDHESSELNERARRALQVNPHRREESEVHMTEAVDLSPAATPPATSFKPPMTSLSPDVAEHPAAAPVQPDPYALDLGRRMRAIHRLREEGPLLENYAEYHTYLTNKLAHMPSDSVGYPVTLERLREVHTRLVALKQRREEDEAVIRSTEYLVPLLRSPEVESGSQSTRARA